jgi:hypothetical protein
MLWIFQWGKVGNSLLNLERETGIEPATNGLGSRYSTIELLPLQTELYLAEFTRRSLAWLCCRSRPPLEDLEALYCRRDQLSYQ